jgi:hypothetical protein
MRLASPPVVNVFYSSPWVPVEWIKAHGHEPRGVWSAPDFGRGAPPLSAGVCAFSEAVLRLAETHSDDAVIFTTTCDQMRRGFDALAAAPGGHGFLFNLPATWQSPAARRMFQSEMERLGRFLEGLGGHAAAGSDLLRLMEQGSQARQRLAAAATQCSARQYAGAIARFHWDGTVELPSSPPSASSAVPLAVVGGPLTASQWGVLDVIETAGARVVLNATETGERSLLPVFETSESFEEPSELPQGFGVRWQAKRDTALELDNPMRHSIQKRRGRSALPTQSKLVPPELKVTPDPFDVLARHYFENIVDVFQRPNTRLYFWLGERLAGRGVRGIVLWVHTGCDLWRAEAQTLRETFRLPVLLLEADESAAGAPREAGRIQAFVEMLR